VVLIGMSISGVMAFRAMAVDRAADDQLKQLQPALRLQYDTVVRDCNKDKAVPDAILVYAENDIDRARAIHTAAMLRVHFPETAEEARWSFTIGGHVYNPTPRAAFKQIANSGLTGDDAAAALLHAVLTEQALGLGHSEVKTTEGKDPATKTFNVFLDPYGKPVRYYRWARSTELDAVPYTPATATSKDPLDPKGKVATWSDATKRNFLNSTNVAAGNPNLGFGTPTAPGRNRVPSVVSYGKGGTNDGFAPGGDDRVGYRLDRQGAQGK
jgi:hypothetical protein